MPVPALRSKLRQGRGHQALGVGKTTAPDVDAAQVYHCDQRLMIVLSFYLPSRFQHLFLNRRGLLESPFSLVSLCEEVQ